MLKISFNASLVGARFSSVGVIHQANEKAEKKTDSLVTNSVATGNNVTCDVSKSDVSNYDDVIV